jgi:ACS family tartrate transporter-like MFS transporter
MTTHTAEQGGGNRLIAFFWRKPAGTLAERTRRRVTLFLIPFLFFLYILAYLDRVNVSVAELAMEEPPLSSSVTSAVGLAGTPQSGPFVALSGFLAGRSEPLGSGGMGFDRATLGFAAGIFFWGYWILEIPSTLSVSRWGARWVFARILVLWGLCAALAGTIGTPFANTFFGWLPSPAYQLYFFRFMLGFFEGGFFPSVIVYLALWFRPQDRAKAIAAFMAAIPLSSMVGVPLSGMLLGVHWFGLPGWRWIFILEGIAPVLAGFATLFFLPDGPRKATWLPSGERDWLMEELEREHKEKQGHGHWAWVHQLGLVLLLTIVYFCLNLTSYGLSMFMPAIIKSQMGIDAGATFSAFGLVTITGSQLASFTASLPYLVSFLAMLINGWHSDRTGERIWHAAVPLAGLSLGIFLAGLFDGWGVVPLLIMIFVVGTCLHAHLPAFWPIPTMFLGATAAAAAIGFINMIGNLGGSVGPTVVGKAATGQTSFGPALLRMAPWPLVGAAIILIIGYTRRRLPAPSGASALQPKDAAVG